MTKCECGKEYVYLRNLEKHRIDCTDRFSIENWGKLRMVKNGDDASADQLNQLCVRLQMLEDRLSK